MRIAGDVQHRALWLQRRQAGVHQEHINVADSNSVSCWRSACAQRLLGLDEHAVEVLDVGMFKELLCFHVGVHGQDVRASALLDGLTRWAAKATFLADQLSLSKK